MPFSLCAGTAPVMGRQTALFPILSTTAATGKQPKTKTRFLTGARSIHSVFAINWHHPDDVPSDVLNRILWWESRGYNTPNPTREKK